MLFKSLLDRIDDPQQLNIDMSSILSHFARFLQRADNSEAAFRVKIKFCALCEALLLKRDLFVIRQESLLRRELLDDIFDWVAAAQSVCHAY